MRRSFTRDDSLILKDAGLVASSAAAQVDGSAQIVNVGTGFYEGNAVIDVSAIEIASNTEVYRIYIQGSNSDTFASGIACLAVLELGANEVTESDTDSAIGRYVLPFTNEHNGTCYENLRAYTTAAGDVATGINYSAFIAKA